MPSTMHGSCPDCGATFDAATPPALVDLILEHPCIQAGRCGVLSPAPVVPADGTPRPARLSCELRAGHTGMHGARQYAGAPGTIDAGFQVDWS